MLPPLDWIGSLLAMAGSVLVASYSRWAPLGWVCYLISNTAWIAYAWSQGDQRALLLQQCFFMVISALGCLRSLRHRKAAHTAGDAAGRP